MSAHPSEIVLQGYEIARQIKRINADVPDSELALSQVSKVGEEAGEVIGAYLRACGISRRSGEWADVLEELADVVIGCYVAGAFLEENLDDAIQAKLAKVFSRGWRESVAASTEPRSTE